MSKRNRTKQQGNRTNRRERRLRIRSIRRNPIDYKKLADALIELATTEPAQEAEALTDEVMEAERRAEQERKAAVRKRRAERAEREDGSRPRDNRPSGRPEDGAA